MFRRRKTTPHAPAVDALYNDKTIAHSLAVACPGAGLSRGQELNAIRGIRRHPRLLEPFLNTIEDHAEASTALGFIGGLAAGIATASLAFSAVPQSFAGGVTVGAVAYACVTVLCAGLTFLSVNVAVIGMNPDLSVTAKARVRKRLLSSGRIALDTEGYTWRLTDALAVVPQLSPSLQQEVRRDIVNLRWDLANVSADRAALEKTIRNTRMDADDRARMEARVADYKRVEGTLYHRAERLAAAVGYAAANERLMRSDERLMAAESRRSGEHTDALVTEYTRALTT